MYKYFIEEKSTNTWLTIGGNTTKDPTHPGLLSFDNKESADNFHKMMVEKDEWKITKYSINEQK